MPRVSWNAGQGLKSPFIVFKRHRTVTIKPDLRMAYPFRALARRHHERRALFLDVEVIFFLLLLKLLLLARSWVLWFVAWLKEMMRLKSVLCSPPADDGWPLHGRR